MQERDAQVTKKLMVIETASQRVPMNSCRNGQPYRGSPFSQRVPHIPVCHTGVPMLLGKWSPKKRGFPFSQKIPHIPVSYRGPHAPGKMVSHTYRGSPF